MARAFIRIAVLSWLLAPAVSAGATLVTSVEGITEYRLNNGLRVLLDPDPTKPTVTVNITYLVGSRHEGYGEKGMAHLLEHLLFKGTPRHKNIPQELTSHGARPNGTTGDDRTNYFETFNATPENLRWALDLEADRMVHSYVARKDLDTEMTVVRNEFESGENNPENVLEMKTAAAAFLWHNYGHSTIGARSDIERVPIERLQAFWRNYYQPDNAVLVVAGKIDEKETLALVETTFGRIPKPYRKLIATYTREPPQDGERHVTVRRAGDVQAVTSIYHGPAATHPDAAPMRVLGEILGATPGGRLHQALVVTRKASRVRAYFQPQKEPGALSAFAQVRMEQSLDEAERALTDAVEGFARQPPAKEEVERARATLLKNIDLTLRNTERLGLALSEWVAMGDWRLYFLNRDRLRTVKPEDVARVAALYLKPSNRTVGTFIPTRAPDRTEVAEGPDPAAALGDYHGDPVMAQGEAFDPTPAMIESRTQRTKVGGIKLAVLAKKTRGGTVAAYLTLHHGDEQHLTGLIAAEGFTAEMLLRGTRMHTRRQLEDELDRLKARVRIGRSGPGSVEVAIETVGENLEAVMRLVAEALRQPAFPAAELEQLRQEQLASIERDRGDPNAIANLAADRHASPYPKGHPRYVRTLDERLADVKAIRLEDVTSFYRAFYGASTGEAAVVGECNPARVSRLVGELFSDWKSPAPFVRVPLRHFQVVAAREQIETPDKANAVFAARLNLALRDDDPDYPALQLANFIFGGGFLSSRLATRIRQKEGVSYGVSSFFWAHPLDPVSQLGAWAIYAPQNAQRLETAFDEELQRAITKGFTAAEIAEAKSGLLQSRQVNRAQDASLAHALAEDLYLDRTMKWDEELERRLAALRPDELQKALQKHVASAQITKALAGDFAHAKPAFDSAAVRPGQSGAAVIPTPHRH